jgi:hypothetical protein
MPLRKSTFFLLLIMLDCFILALFSLQAARSGGQEAAERELRRGLVARLSLTDLVLFTDARYTRHPSMADLNTPFQDSPLSLEHFPSGSLLGPPDHVRVYERHQ